jgi:hypothetical protein
MNRPVACLASVLLLCAAIPAVAQMVKPGSQPSAAERAAKRCKENRGTDCDTREGLSEWRRQEQPLSPEAQQAAAAARSHRELCAKNKKAAGC